MVIANLLRELPQSQAVPKVQVPKELQAQLREIATLDPLHTEKLNCFEQFSAKPYKRPDVIETLLHTSHLGATNQRDYISGIIGITGFPGKAMPCQDWIMTGELERSTPIDYSASLASILCAVTWALLMKGGLAVLAKFKAFPSDDDSTSEHSRPSWVIDWRLCAKLLKIRGPEHLHHIDPQPNRIDEAWHIAQWGHFRDINRRPFSDMPPKFVPGPPPVEHSQFCDDNRGAHGPVHQAHSSGYHRLTILPQRQRRLENEGET